MRRVTANQSAPTFGENTPAQIEFPQSWISQASVCPCRGCPNVQHCADTGDECQPFRSWSIYALPYRGEPREPKRKFRRWPQRAKGVPA